MLTGDLIRARVKGSAIAPSLIDPAAPRLVERAESLLAIFQDAASAHRTRAEIEAACRTLEGTGTDHKLTRGLAKILMDGCEFEAQSELDPVEVRARVFRHAARTGPLARSPGLMGRRTAADVMAEVAAQLGVDPEALRQALYADLKSEQRVTRREGPQTAEDVLHRYNVALVQALLYRARWLRVQLRRPDPKRIRQLFRYLKFFELMYRAEPTPDGLRLLLDGPQSLLTRSTRYGSQLAKFFPAVLLQTGPWHIEAEILWGHKRKLRKSLELDHELGLRSHYTDRGVWRSRTEEHFEARFREADTGWEIGPGELLDLGEQRIQVPDFTFRKDGRVAHLDIVGYWRRTWLRKRLADTPPNVVLAVSRRLAGEKASMPQTTLKQVVDFAELIPVKKVLARIEAVAE